MVTFVFMCVLTGSLLVVAIVCLICGVVSQDKETREAMGLFLFILFWCVFATAIGTYNAAQAVDNKGKPIPQQVEVIR